MHVPLNIVHRQSLTLCLFVLIVMNYRSIISHHLHDTLYQTMNLRSDYVTYGTGCSFKCTQCPSNT